MKLLPTWRVLHVEQQAVGDHVLIAELVGRARTGRPPHVPYCARHGAWRTVDSIGVVSLAFARVAHLLREEVVEAQLVALEQLHFRLQVRRLQLGEVGVQSSR
jgi:hypothetical protein